MHKLKGLLALLSSKSNCTNIASKLAFVDSCFTGRLPNISFSVIVTLEDRGVKISEALGRGILAALLATIILPVRAMVPIGTTTTVVVVTRAAAHAVVHTVTHAATIHVAHVVSVTAAVAAHVVSVAAAVHAVAITVALQLVTVVLYLATVILCLLTVAVAIVEPMISVALSHTVAVATVVRIAAIVSLISLIAASIDMKKKELIAFFTKLLSLRLRLCLRL